MRLRDEPPPKVKDATQTARDVIYASTMAIACLVSYWVMTYVLSRSVDRPTDLLGGMWAVAATVFVFRENHVHSLSAGVARLIATCVSFALCLLYLLLLPSTPVGMAALIGLGTVAAALLGRRDDFITVGITTAVIMVVAAISPENAWQQPLLRVADTFVGVVIGVAFRWGISFLFGNIAGDEVP
jgi:uncharacterized membrane protein YccC